MQQGAIAMAGPREQERPFSKVILELEDIAVHFGGVRAVDGVSFDVPEGRIVGVMGPNGSGKSTLMAGISRLLDLTRGRMRLDGVSYERVPTSSIARMGFGRTFQTARLLPEMSILENIMLGADVDRIGRASMTRADIRDVVEEAVERTSLHDYVNVLPSEVSYGVQRRVEIARALAMKPRILILDEPTAGMNHSERDDVSRLLMTLREAGMTQILVEHDVQMMVNTCDHVVAMNFGKCIAQGSPGEVVRTEAVLEAYLGRKWRKKYAGN